MLPGMSLVRAYLYNSIIGQWCLIGGIALVFLGVIGSRLGFVCGSGLYIVGLLITLAGTLFMFVASLLQNRLKRQLREREAASPPEKDPGSGPA